MASFAWFSPLLLLISGVNAEMGVRIPATFVFGDSLFDPGYNNNLVTLAKANYFPHGIDFPGGTTGRFCNGRTVADYLGNILGLPLIPPFNNPSSKCMRIIQGVNFASAGSGILNTTGWYFGDLWPMDKQIKNFQKTVLDLDAILTSNGGDVEGFLAKSLFLECVGSNDFINNYLFPLSFTSHKYSLQEFHALLIQEYTRQFKDLHRLGGRKFVIAGLGPLGCIPYVLGYYSNNKSLCLDEFNEIASHFNNNVKKMIDVLNANLSGASFLYWDIYVATMRILNNSSVYGFKNTHKACCGAGRDKGQIICEPFLLFECTNRTQFVFWDPHHPTNAFNAILVN